MTWLDKHERIFELIETRYELHPPKAADMVAVVRCRDCKHYDDYLGSCMRRYTHFATEPDGFCAWAVRREQ